MDVYAFLIFTINISTSSWALINNQTLSPFLLTEISICGTK